MAELCKGWGGWVLGVTVVVSVVVSGGGYCVLGVDSSFLKGVFTGPAEMSIR